MTTATKTPAKTDRQKQADRAKKFKGTYKDFLGKLEGKDRSTARKAWRSVHGANVVEV